jgi:carboxypeptidase C (cathepsin A)
MYLNGIGLVYAVLDLGTLIFPNGVDDTYINYLPSYAATASYHKMLKDPPADLNAFLDEARRFAGREYSAALMKGSRLTAEEKADMAKKVSRFTGLSEDYLIKANLRVNLGQFMKELQRSKELTTGRLDARYSGPTVDMLGEFAEYDPQSNAVSGAYTALFNNYIRWELKFGEGKEYHISSEGAGRSWDWKRQGNRGDFFPGTPNVTEDLLSAMVTNTHLRVEVEAGYYDLATPFFAIERTMDHLGLPQALQGHFHINYYDAGHMMYLREADLAKLKSNVAAFIDSASKP